MLPNDSTHAITEIPLGYVQYPSQPPVTVLSAQARDPYLDVAAARSCVEAILEQLKASHVTITENYEHVQMTTTTIKRVQRQWDRAQRDARKASSIRMSAAYRWYRQADFPCLEKHAVWECEIWLDDWVSRLFL